MDKIILQSWQFGYINKLSEIFRKQSYLYNCDDYLPNLRERSNVGDWMHRILTKSQGTKYFAIVSEGQVAGGINISFKKRLWSTNAEIGYFIDYDFWNSDIVNQAIKQVCDYIFDNYPNINRIIAQTYDDNEETKHPLINNGFHHDATLPQYIKKEEQMVDCHIFSLLRSNFIKDFRQAG